MQDSSVAELSNEQRPNDDMEDDLEIMEGKADLWTPLNCLVEAANRTKSSKSSQGSSLAKSELPCAHDCDPYSSEPKSRIESANGHEGYMPKTKNKEHGQVTKVQDDKNGTNSLPVSVKRRRLTAARKRAAMSGAASAQAMLGAAAAKSNRKNSPIWFSLVASEDQ